MDALYHRKRIRCGGRHQPHCGRKDRSVLFHCLIPHTGSETALLWKHPGDLVNIECDYLGKYVEQLLKEGPKEGLTMGMLETLGHGGHYGL